MTDINSLPVIAVVTVHIDVEKGEYATEMHGQGIGWAALAHLLHSEAQELHIISGCGGTMHSLNCSNSEIMETE